MPRKHGHTQLQTQNLCQRDAPAPECGKIKTHKNESIASAPMRGNLLCSQYPRTLTSDAEGTRTHAIENRKRNPEGRTTIWIWQTKDTSKRNRLPWRQCAVKSLCSRYPTLPTSDAEGTRTHATENAKPMPEGRTRSRMRQNQDTKIKCINCLSANAR